MTYSAKIILAVIVGLIIGLISGIIITKKNVRLTKEDIEIAKKVCANSGGYFFTGHSILGDLTISCTNGDTAICTGENCALTTIVQFSSSDEQN